jgi:cell division protein FtsQ
MNRLLKILLLIPTLYLVVMPVFYAHYFYSRPCSRIKITVIDSSQYHFVTKRDIQNTIYSNNGSILGKPVKEVQISEIENTMNRYRELKAAEAYISIDGTLHIYADQRTPIMRVMAANGGDYYVDVEGVVIRRRNLYTPRLHVVGGNVNISQAMLDGVSVLDTSIKNSILKDIYYIVSYINRDKFWSAQIDQIFVDSDDEIDLIPRVGNYIVHLGTAENYEGKLRNLEAFYDKVLPEVGWNKYARINLAYRDQIVCKKR